MISKVDMWAAECDSCEEVFETYEGYTALTDKQAVKERIDESEWTIVKTGKVYCPNCHFTSYNEDTDENHAYSLPSGTAKDLGVI